MNAVRKLTYQAADRLARLTCLAGARGRMAGQLALVVLLSASPLLAESGPAGVHNQIVNGDFANNLDGWHEETVEDLTSNWSSNDAAESSVSGSFWGQAKGGSTFPSQYDTHGTVGWQCLDVEPDRMYRLAMHAKGRSGISTLRARGSLYVKDITGAACPTLLTYVGEFPPAESRRVTHFTPFSGEGPWEFLSLDFRTGPAENKVQAGLHVWKGQVNANGGYAANLYFDNVVVGKVRPDLKVDMTVSETSLRPLQTVTITVDLASLTNNGMQPEVRVFHADRLSLISSNCPGSVVAGQQNGEHRFLWFGIPDDVEAYARTCMITARAKSGVEGDFQLRAEATCGECGIETQLANNQYTIDMVTQAAPDVGVQQLTLEPFPRPGGAFDLGVAIRNYGTASAISTVTVSFSPTVEFVPTDSGLCANFSAAGSGASGLVSTGSGETVNCTLRFTVPSTQLAAQLVATVSTATTNDYNSANNTASASTRIVRLLVNRSIDGFDRIPGDGICESSAGSGDCSLRAAVMEANALGGSRLIEVPYSNFAYQLTRTAGDDDVLKGDIDIRKTMTIRGIPNATGGLPLLSAAFASAAADRVFSVDTGSSSATVIENLTIAGQNLSPPTNDGTAGNGGLIHQASGKLILRNLRLRNGRSETGFGGAVYSADELTVDRVRMHDNAAKHAGALAMVRGGYAFFKVVDSEFHSNAASATGSGGAIYINAQNALLAIQRSTLHGNQAAWGGAITIAKTLGTSLLQSTISGNTAGSGGGGLYISTTALSIGSSTIWNNQANPGDDTAGLGGGIYRGGTATVTLYNSILANNTAQTRGTAPFLTPYAANCYPTISSDGYNSLGAVTSDSACEVTATTGDHFNTAPALAALADNGGPTPTHAFVSPGNEVNRGNPECRVVSGGVVMTTDQRGALRPADGRADGTPRCDKGAYELSDSARITVTKPGDGSGSVYSSPTGISCGATCSAIYAFGTEVELTASASPGSSFAGWDGDCAHAGTARCTVSAQGDVQVTAIFTANASTYTLSVDVGKAGNGSVVSDPSGVDCPGACSAAFDAGSSVTLTATPSADSVFLGFYGANCGGSTDPCTVSMTGNRSISAAFDIDYSDLVVTMAGGGVGRVLSTPIGIDCPGDCQEKYAVTQTVTLNAQPSVGSVFGGWSGACTGTGACTLDMDLGPHAVTATFSLDAEALFANGFE